MVIEMRAVLECPLCEKVMNANECETGLRGRDPTESLKTLRESCPRECPTFRRKEECVCLFRTYCLQNGATAISHCRSKHSIITLQLHSGFSISHLPLFVCISGFSSRFLWFCMSIFLYIKYCIRLTLHCLNQILHNKVLNSKCYYCFGPNQLSLISTEFCYILLVTWFTFFALLSPVQMEFSFDWSSIPMCLKQNVGNPKMLPCFLVFSKIFGSWLSKYKYIYIYF